MHHKYNQIPLSFLLKKEEFQQATEIYLTAFDLDLHFAQTYLSSLQSDAKLYVVVDRMEEGVLQFLQRAEACSFQYFITTQKRMLGFKDILMGTGDSYLSICTTSNFTQMGLDDGNGKHRYSDVESEFNLLKRKYFSCSRYPFK